VSVAQHPLVISTEVSPPALAEGRHSGEISNYLKIPRLRPSGFALNDKKDSSTASACVEMTEAIWRWSVHTYYLP